VQSTLSCQDHLRCPCLLFCPFGLNYGVETVLKQEENIREQIMKHSQRGFDQKYSSLVKKFSRLAKSEGNIYLPTIRPPRQVDYVFIGMEPSLGHWSKTPQEAEEKIGRGFKDFAFSVGDFILHHCIREYLCRNQSSTYYVTNLSKGAMTVREANDNPVERWERWLPLLRDELTLVQKRTTRFVAIGRSVDIFLASKGFSNVHTILHYSQQAAGYRNKWVEWNEKAFENFKRQVSGKDIIATAKAVTEQAKMEWNLTSSGLRRLERQDLTDSQKMLVFGYKCYFTRQLLGSASKSLQEKVDRKVE
jgi:hypothetical protein